MFRDLYAAELEYLYAHAAELGREHARIAPMLGRDADAGVARLAQTVAFLSARLRQRLDDDLPELIHPVVESLRPWLLRPLPSATIVELVPDPSMKEPLVVRAGSVFGSRPIEGVACAFRSSTDVHVRPWRLEEVTLSNDRDEIRVRLSLRPDAVFGGLAGPLRLFFAMPTATALELRSKILRTTRSVVGRAPGGSTEIALSSPDDPVVAAPFASPPEGADALFALRAYFTWPEQFAFIEVPHIDRLAALGPKNRVFEIVLRLAESLPRSLTVDASVLRLHCVPAVNVHPLRVANAPLVRGRCALDLAGKELYAIEEVTLVGDDLSTRTARPYAEFFPPACDANGRLPLLYRAERVPSVSGPELDVTLAFIDPSRSAPLAGASAVDVTALVTDGDRATRIGVGELCVASPASPPLVSFRNVTAISRWAPPALEGDRLWRWIALLKTPFWELTQRASLAEALALVNLAAWARWPESKPGIDAFEAIVRVAANRQTRPGRDEIFPGARVDVDLRVGSFSGLGDVDLFGSCLASFLASALREHEWVELALRDDAGRPLVDYPPRFGTRREL